MSGKAPNVKRVPRGSNPTKQNVFYSSSNKKLKVNNREGQDNKKKSCDVLTRCSYTIAEKAQLRGLIEADVQKAKSDKGAEKKTVSEICKKYKIHYTNYFRGCKLCSRCYGELQDYLSHGVKCTAMHCESKLCY